MKEIRVSNGRVALVDDVDYRLLATLAWQSHDGQRVSHGYVSQGRRNKLMMHNLIARSMGLEIPDGHEVDHKNRDGFDNQRHNLRVITHAMNLHNRDLQVNNTSGVSGVCWDTQNGRWKVQIRIPGMKTRTHLGLFARFEDAVAARLRAEVRYLGGEYTTNLPGPASDRAVITP